MKTQDYKKWTKALLVLLLSFGFTSLRAEANPSDHGVSFQVFYDELAPYGDWVRDQNHGYVWLPYAEQGFHPYGTNGHWSMTSYGNTWVSYYDWGWAPFHYGRWYFDNYYQSWAWVPGYEWGPAWVNWRTGGGYYGWAPLAPGFSFNVAVNLPNFYFVFIPRNRIYHRYAHRYYASYRNRVRIYNQTTIINNTVIYNNNRYVAGPNRREIERVTRRAVPVYQVQGSDRAGRASVSINSISLYRPELENSRQRTADARPTRVLDANTARSSRNPATDRSVSNGSRSAYSNAGNATAPSSRSERTVRSSAPVRESRSFEARPDEDNRSSTSAPSRESQVRPQVGTNGSRSSNPDSGRPSAGTQQKEQTRTQSSQPVVKSNQTQRSQPSKPEVRQTQPQRSQSQQPSVRTAPQKQSSPDVRSNNRTAPTSSRVSTPAGNQKSGSARVSTPAKKESSPSTTSRSSSSRTVKPKGN